MKKIMIITLPLHNNYGGILQAFALQTVLKNYGFSVDVYNREKTFPNFTTKLYQAVKNVVKLCIGRHVDSIWPLYDSYENYTIISQNTKKFINKYINLHSIQNINEVASNYDVYVVGSDQVWRPAYFGKIENAYLDFLQDRNVKRLAYAASFGTNEWEYSKKQTEICSKLIKRFDAVSVREKSGIDLCKQYLGVDTIHLPDPTMLLTKEDYINLIEKNNTPKSKGELMLYVLDENDELIKIVDRIKTEYKITPFSVNSKYEDKKAKLNDRIQPPVENWLRGFFDADFIITDSFHACVFSILFNKEFLVFGNKERGMARFESLLDEFGLKDRLVGNVFDCELVLEKKIDWTHVNSHLNNRRKDAFAFLEKHLLV